MQYKPRAAPYEPPRARAVELASLRHDVNEYCRLSLANGPTEKPTYRLAEGSVVYFFIMLVRLQSSGLLDVCY